jgi:hypothetical protein
LFEHDLFGKPAPTFPDHALAAKPRSRKASVLDIFGPHRPAAGGNTEFVNAVALVLGHMGKIPECCRNIDER